MLPKNSTFKKIVTTLAACVVVLILCQPAFPQGNLGRLMGTVTDQTGGVIAGASVSVVDVQRGVSRTLVSDDSGDYSAPSLIPGQYAVTKSRSPAEGFGKLGGKGMKRSACVYLEQKKGGGELRPFIKSAGLLGLLTFSSTPYPKSGHWAAGPR